MMNLSDEYSDEQCYRAISYVDNEISLYRKEGDWDAAEKYDCILSMLCRLQDLIEDLQQENDASADLTWRVEAPGVGVVARFHCRDEARRYLDASLWADATITGPDSQPVDHGNPDDCKFSDERKAKLQGSPRLVPVSDQIVVVDGKPYRIDN